ncbi:pantoate--beta-alanine ligase [Maricaulis sp. CAU 1757]
MLNAQIPHATTVSALRARLRSWRDERLRVGFVPTMGALHAGHLALLKLARAHCDRVVVSIFVNPKQFAAGEDLDTYPRTLIDDVEKLAAADCSLIYLPDESIMYPDAFDTRVSVGGPSAGLESDSRPHFFDGVATVVAKLFNQVRPDMAFFGEKDYQQLQVIRQLARDLDYGIDIIGGETIREKDGLALSSRNAYLGAEERERASHLNRIGQAFADALSRGMPVASATKTANSEAEGVFDAVDYFEARDADTLAPLDDGAIERPARVLAAVRIGKTRLIDNWPARPA